jgi:predicted flap endonuclease-1-like 5' DNA nuclease
MLELVLPKNYINIVAGVVSMIFEQFNGASVSVPVPTVTVAVNEVEPAVTAKPAADDLTAITGIGPTFAKRLKAAGIKTYKDLAAASPEFVKESAKLADWQADPADWIAAAKDLS